MPKVWVANSNVQQSGGAASAWALRLVLLCIWLLALLTITPLERDDVEGVASMDRLALAKLIVRLGALPLLTLVVLGRGADAYRGRRLWMLAPLGLYLGWALLSTAWSPLKAVSIGQFTSLLVLCLVAWAIAAWDEGEATARRVLAHTTVALWIFSLGMLAAYVFLGGGGDRFQFALAHPTTVGATASMGLLLLLASLVIWPWSWPRLLLVPGLLVHGSVLLVAHNRTALGVLALVAVVTLAIYGDRILLAFASAAASVAILAAAVIDPGWWWLFDGLDTAGEYLTREQKASELSAFSGREELWLTMWESYRQSPWIGHGYFVSSRSGILDIWNRSTNFNAHNMFLQALVSTGVVGLALFMWGLGRPIVYALQRLAGDTEARRRAGLFVLVASWLVLWGMLDVAVLGPVTPYGVAFFVVLGLLGGTAATASRPASASESRATATYGAIHP